MKSIVNHFKYGRMSHTKVVIIGLYRTSVGGIKEFWSTLGLSYNNS